VGQEEELDGIVEKALKTGASKCLIEDLKEDFVENYVTFNTIDYSWIIRKN